MGHITTQFSVEDQGFHMSPIATRHLMEWFKEPYVSSPYIPIEEFTSKSKSRCDIDEEIYIEFFRCAPLNFIRAKKRPDPT